MNDVRAELISVIDGAVADASNTNIFMSIKAAMLNLPEKVKAGQIDLPIYVVDAATFLEDQEFGIDNRSYRAPVRIIVIRKTAGTNVQEQIESELKLIHDAVFESSHTHFQAIERGSIDTSPDDDAVAALIELSQNALAGTLSFDPGLLCGEWQ